MIYVLTLMCWFLKHLSVFDKSMFNFFISKTNFLKLIHTPMYLKNLVFTNSEYWIFMSDWRYAPSLLSFQFEKIASVLEYFIFLLRHLVDDWFCFVQDHSLANQLSAYSSLASLVPWLGRMTLEFLYLSVLNTITYFQTVQYIKSFSFYEEPFHI